MATGEASLVVAPADISAHWQIALDATLEPLTTLRNLTLRSSEYVIRETAMALESVRWEHELVGFVAPHVPEVVAPLAAPDGSTFLAREGRVVSVFPFVAAPTADRTDPRIRREAPRLLARLHRVAAEWPGVRPRPGRPSWRHLDWRRNETWDWTIVERTPALERAYAAATEWLAAPPDLRVSAIHGDFHPENLLAEGGKIAGLIDWEFARVDWPAADLAAAVTVFALQADGNIDRSIADEVVTAYVDAGGEDESHALEPLMRQFLLAVALVGRTMAATGASWNPRFMAMIEQGLASLV